MPAPSATAVCAHSCLPSRPLAPQRISRTSSTAASSQTLPSAALPPHTSKWCGPSMQAADISRAAGASPDTCGRGPGQGQGRSERAQPAGGSARTPARAKQSSGGRGRSRRRHLGAAPAGRPGVEEPHITQQAVHACAAVDQLRRWQGHGPLWGAARGSGRRFAAQEQAAQEQAAQEQAAQRRPRGSHQAMAGQHAGAVRVARRRPAAGHLRRGRGQGQGRGRAAQLLRPRPGARCAVAAALARTCRGG